MAGRTVKVRGARGVQRQRAKKGGWTEGKEAKFIATLANTCNVTLACTMARVASSTVYSHRRQDAAFRTAWNEAIAQGYARLELEMLERAINGEMREIVHKDGSSEVRVDYDPRTALTLLRLHRDTAGEPERREAMVEELGEEGGDELRDRLIAKLKRVRVQLLGAAAAEAGGWAAIGPPALDLDGAVAADEGRMTRAVDALKAAVELLARGDYDEAVAMIATLPLAALIALDTRFEAWAAAGQQAPQSDGWRVWLVQGGRGFGKTRAGAEWVHGMATAKYCRIALVGATLDEARRVMVEGPSGVIEVARAHGRTLKWEPSQRKLTWPNGSSATLFSGEDGNGLRGPEHDFAWCDELAKWQDAEATWDNLMFGLRRGARPRALVTTTPRTIPLLARLRGSPTTIVSGGTTADNVNLSQEFVNQMIRSYKGTRLEQEELRGQPLDEVAGSLWPRALIARCRVAVRTLPPMDRIVVGVDPPAGASATSDACGIIVAGRAGRHVYVLADASVKGASPERWAAAVRAATAHWHADRIVAEANNGGDMVRSVLVAAGIGAGQVRLVHASRGKSVRAEPVSLAFEAGAGWFAGVFGSLEDELAGMQVGGGYEGPTRSPDRADAMVWAMTELMGRMGEGPRVMRL